MGFPTKICQWVSSFISEHSASSCIDGIHSLFFPIEVGVPQGSPVSPVLAWLYAAEPLRILTTNPAFSGVDLPVGLRSYVDDLAFLAISDSLHENVIMLKHTLDSAIEEFGKIGMLIDPDKSELMHFSWKQNTPSPPLSFTHGVEHEERTGRLLARTVPSLSPFPHNKPSSPSYILERSHKQDD